MSSALVLALALAADGWQDIPKLPTPEAAIGFKMGADFHLITWPQVLEYCRAIDKGSDRVAIEELGASTEGRPFFVVVVSNEATIKDLPTYKRIQRDLSHPLDDPSRHVATAAAGKPVVLITCSIHSSETASTHMALELLHDLAVGNDPETREVLDNTILLLVPSVNPDGVDKVAEWYERTKGKPWEGGGMPWLYHKYAGHDTNRDWFMLNLKETQLLTRLLYQDWYPTITYDVHQMGGKGARMFVPPFHDPINPNLDGRIHQSIAMIGAHMAADLTRAGKRGVLTNAMYDNWWNGGNRTAPQRHNMVGVLTEAASVRLASPVFLSADDLQGGSRGFRDHMPATNFVSPWPGGWWRLRDIVDYELITARALLVLAARYRAMFQTQYLDMSLSAIEKGRSEPPFAWVVPTDQDDLARAATMVRALHDSGIEVDRATGPFAVAGVTYPAGSWVLRAAQPYRSHLKDMMERQVYPARFTATGAAEPPYDVAGWTLPLLMGVKAVVATAPFTFEGESLKQVDLPPRSEAPTESADYLAWVNRANADFRVIAALAGLEGVRVLMTRVTVGDQDALPGTILVPSGSPAATVLREARSRQPGTSPVVGLKSSPTLERSVGLYPLTKRRVGLYQPWVPSMDEGWTRLVLENHGVPYVTLHDADLRAGGLRARVDVLLVPSIGARTLRDGFGPDETEPAYVGGLGQEGAHAIRDFVNDGGRAVFLEESCAYAIDELSLPVRNVLAGLKTSEFYCPGSIVRVEAAQAAGEPVTLGMPSEWTACFDRSFAFEIGERAIGARVVARYARNDVLESGWLLGASKLEGKAAIVEVTTGDGGGSVILFGFPPQFRGQTHGTFRLLFNALLMPARGPS